MSEQARPQLVWLPDGFGGGEHAHVYCATDYDALHAEAEALRVALLEIASANPAERGIEWAKSYASDGLKGAGSELYARWLDTFNEAEALRAENAKLRAALAEQGERQEAVAEYQQLSRYGNWDRVDKAVYDLGKLGDTPEKFRALYTTPQPGPDVRALLSADDVRDACANAVSVFAEETNASQCREVAEYMREVLLAQIAHKAGGV